MSLYAYFVIRWIKNVLGPLKMQKMCKAAVLIEPPSLEIVPDHFKTQDMCNEAVRREPYYIMFWMVSRQKRCAMRQGAENRTICGMFLITLERSKFAMRL